MFKNILVAYDGSDHSRKAAKLAGEVAREQKNGVKVWIVTVMDPIPRELGEPNFSQLIEERTAIGQKLIDEAIELVCDEVEITRELVFGTPAEGIIQVAETRGCDLIIMGTRGSGVLRDLVLGSQVLKVIGQAACPVLVVK
jgi:nucleotide-binding universal stress UspA family protein